MKARDIEYEIAQAVYEGEINQLLTAEVAERFNISSRQALRVLKKIVSGEVKSLPFQYDEDYEGVRVKDGSVFVKGDHPDFAEGHRGTQHYTWFLTYSGSYADEVQVSCLSS